nr:hypothetical protein [Tanacetum cinerariifolium]
VSGHKFRRDSYHSRMLLQVHHIKSSVFHQSGIENSKKTSTSKDSSKGKSLATSSKSGKSAKEQVKEPIFVQDSDDDAEFDNVDIPMDHGEYLGNTKEQVNEDVVTKQDWHKKSNADSSLDPE